MLSTTPVRYFIEVAERGSVRAASEGLLVAPSAVSRQVRLLERDLGVLLFDRSAAGMTLTPAGRAALEHFADSTDRDEAFREHLKGVVAAPVPLVRFGLLEGLVSLVPALTARLSRRSAGTRLDLQMLPSSQIVDLVVGGELDAGFSSGRRIGRTVRVEGSAALPLLVVVPPGHRLAERDRLNLDELDGLPVVLPDRSFGIRAELDRACREHRVVPQVVGETNTLTLALELAVARGAATLLTAAALPDDVAQRGIRAVPVADKRLAAVPVSLVVARHEPRPDAARLAVQLGRDLLGSRAVRSWH